MELFIEGDHIIDDIINNTQDEIDRQNYLKEERLKKKLNSERCQYIKISLEKWMKKENFCNGLDTEFIYIVVDPKIKNRKLTHSILLYGNIGYFYLQHVYDVDFPSLKPAIFFGFEKFPNDFDWDELSGKKILIGRTKFLIHEIEKVGTKIGYYIGAEETFWNCDVFCNFLIGQILFAKFMESFDMDLKIGFLFKESFTKPKKLAHRHSIAQLDVDFKQIVNIQSERKNSEKLSKKMKKKILHYFKKLF